MHECELVLCRLSHGTALFDAMRAEGVSAKLWAEWLRASANKIKFNRTMELRRDVLAMRRDKYSHDLG